jgi:hypothetical protein
LTLALPTSKSHIFISLYSLNYGTIISYLRVKDNL